MSESRPEIRIFVALPGTTMGERAAWRDLSEIKEYLLEPVSAEISRRLGIRTQLIIEKEKTSSGRVHRSMFNEAVAADIYIADLTGSNPNVYLELGVRWALRDAVTILICQDVEEIRFNVSANRVILYGPMPSQVNMAIDRISSAAVEGFTGEAVDSPVRDSLDRLIVQQNLSDLEDILLRSKDGKRYSVYISSTTRDLQSETMSVANALLRASYIPLTTASFAATSEGTWDHIRRDIDTCDYFVLVTAGRLGSIGSDGKSFVEREYDYAREVNKPILVFMRDADYARAHLLEETPEGRERLARFHERLTTEVICHSWRNEYELAMEIVNAVDVTASTDPQAGWIRTDSLASRLRKRSESS
jgi:hypothetical protein